LRSRNQGVTITRFELRRYWDGGGTEIYLSTQSCRYIAQICECPVDSGALPRPLTSHVLVELFCSQRRVGQIILKNLNLIQPTGNGLWLKTFVLDSKLNSPLWLRLAFNCELHG